MTEAARKTFERKFSKVVLAENNKDIEDKAIIKFPPWTLMQWLLRCLAKRDFLNVFEAGGAEEGGDPEDAQDLEAAILHALFRGTKAQIREHKKLAQSECHQPDKWIEGALGRLLELAVKWDCFELAQQLLFQSSGIASQPAAAALAGGSGDDERQLSKADFLKALPNALLKDCHAFVREFIQRGLEMDRIFPVHPVTKEVAKPTHYNDPSFAPLALLYEKSEVCVCLVYFVRIRVRVLVHP